MSSYGSAEREGSSITAEIKNDKDAHDNCDCKEGPRRVESSTQDSQLS